MILTAVCCCSCKKEEHACDSATHVVILGDQSKDWKSDGWNLYGWIAFAFAGLSFIYALKTFYAQKKTERHTQNAPLSVQVGTLEDLHRHLYRNLICTSAAIYKYKIQGKATEHPSESNMLKLKTMPDAIILNIDADKLTYKQMHEFKLLLRNYNLEIECAVSHLLKQDINPKCLNSDFDNLLFKPLHLAKESFELIKCVKLQEKEQSTSEFKKWWSKRIIDYKAIYNYFRQNDKKQKLSLKTIHNKIIKEKEKKETEESIKNIFITMIFTLITEHISKLKGKRVPELAKDNIIHNADTGKAIWRSYKNLTKKLNSILGENIYFDSERGITFCPKKEDGSEYLDAVIESGPFVRQYQKWFVETIEDRADIDVRPDDVKEMLLEYRNDNTKKISLYNMLTNMLNIDTAIETDRIGMINY